ncbi:hypothetical protein DSECCO2_392790 [anaerobic digester metagenome]|nr:hypothetical protein [Methanoculleus sp.]MCK9317298.1 hypothetical protein [Methanoculleus sp.]
MGVKTTIWRIFTDISALLSHPHFALNWINHTFWYKNYQIDRFIGQTWSGIWQWINKPVVWLFATAGLVVVAELAYCSLDPGSATFVTLNYATLGTCLNRIFSLNELVKILLVYLIFVALYGLASLMYNDRFYVKNFVDHAGTGSTAGILNNLLLAEFDRIGSLYQDVSERQKVVSERRQPVSSLGDVFTRPDGIKAVPPQIRQEGFVDSSAFIAAPSGSACSMSTTVSPDYFPTIRCSAVTSPTSANIAAMGQKRVIV